MDSYVSAWNIMGRRATFEGLYGLLGVFVQCLLMWNNSGCYETNQGLHGQPPHKIPGRVTSIPPR